MTKPYHDNFLPYNTMTLNGKGQVTAIPNIAIIHLGVETRGDNLEVTQSENARISQDILQGLKQLGITDIKTFQYNIDKIYSYENETRVDKGYSVRNILEIRLNNMDQVGNVIDTAVKNGANVVDFITFEVSNPDFYYQQALNLAVMDSIQKARSISVQLKVPVDPVPIHIVENSAVPFSSSTVYNLKERGFATPIEPGHYQINAAVTVEFLY